MKKIFILLATLALLTLAACTKDDTKEKLQETTTEQGTGGTTPGGIEDGTTTGGGIEDETTSGGGIDGGTGEEPVELIKNGDFSTDTDWTINESGNSSWGETGTGGDIAVTYDTGAAVVAIVRGDSTINYEAQLYQKASLVSGKTYTVSFDYLANNPSTFVFAIETENGKTQYLPGENVTASRTKQTYTKTFIATETTETDPLAKVVFHLASAPTNAQFTLDNVSLKEHK